MITRKLKQKSNKRGSKNKYNAKKKEIDNIKFDSEIESNFYLTLKQQKKDNIIQDFSCHPKFILQDKFIIYNNEVIEGSNPIFNKTKNKYKLKVYRAITYEGDFLVKQNNIQALIDIKGGILTTEFKIKMKMFIKKYPFIKFKIIMYRKRLGGWISYEDYLREKNKK